MSGCPPHSPSAAEALRPAAGWLRRRALEAIDPLVLALLRQRATRLPPRRLRARAGAPGAWDFLAGGRATAEALDLALAQAGLGRLSERRSLLDFGCGAARVLVHVAALAPEAMPTGVDVDTAAIRWARAHLGGLALAAIRSEPPLPFGDRSFELVYSISVFSHLGEGAQDRWLAELARVLAPGGVALLSVHGPSAFDAFASGAVRSAWCAPAAFARGPLGERELVFVDYRRMRWNRGELPGVGDAYGLTFHAPGYVRAHWSRWFEVLAVRERAISGWQDLVVCRRA